MNISSSREHAEVIARFYLRKDPHGDPLHKRLVNLPSILRKKTKTKPKKRSSLHADQKSTQSHNSESPAALAHRKTDATINRLQTVDPKKKTLFSARIYLQTVRLGEGRKRAAVLGLQVCRPLTPCVRVCVSQCV